MGKILRTIFSLMGSIKKVGKLVHTKGFDIVTRKDSRCQNETKRGTDCLGSLLIGGTEEPVRMLRAVNQLKKST